MYIYKMLVTACILSVLSLADVAAADLDATDLGYVRGTFRLAFEYDGKSYENHGKYVTILRKGSKGVPRITHHIWDDSPRAE